MFYWVPSTNALSLSQAIHCDTYSMTASGPNSLDNSPLTSLLRGNLLIAMNEISRVLANLLRRVERSIRQK